MMLNINSFGKGPALVFFHGLGFDHHIWLDLASKLADKFSLYLVDLPGFGNSSLMSWEDFKASLLVIPQPFALIAWSLGGLWATRFALEERTAVAHLVNVATTPFFVKEKSWPGIAPPVLTTFYNDLLQNPEQCMNKYTSMLVSCHFVRPLFHENLIPGLKNGFKMLKSCDLRPFIANLACPTCYMFGKYDLIVPRSTLVTMQKKHANFDYVLFENAAHAPFISHRELFINELLRFLS